MYDAGPAHPAFPIAYPVSSIHHLTSRIRLEKQPIMFHRVRSLLAVVTLAAFVSLLIGGCGGGQGPQKPQTPQEQKQRQDKKGD